MIDVLAMSESVCFTGETTSDDCFRVTWGSDEQFQAELRPSRGTGSVSWPSGKVWPFSVTFEVPANAIGASLIFQGHRLLLNLEGDQQRAADGRAPSPAPVPAASSDAPPGTSGYFLGDEYGIAISGLSRRSNDDLPTWTAVTLDVAIVTFRKDPALGPSIRVGTGLKSGCFLGGRGEQCVRVLWGPEE